MESYNGWNIFSMGDMIARRRKPTIEISDENLNSFAEGLHYAVEATSYSLNELELGLRSMASATWGTSCPSERFIAVDTVVDTVEKDLQPFKCPNCGGNKYKRIGQKVICEYCDTQFE